MAGKHRTLREVETFIRRQLKPKLERDFKALRIIREGDLECTTYYHLRNYIGESHQWRIIARRHVPVTGHYVDLLIFHGRTAVIAVELKWEQTQIGDKDRQSLRRAIKHLGVNKAYWISAVWSGKPKGKLQKSDDEKHLLHRVIVRIGLKGTKLKQWRQERRRFGSQMAARPRG